MYTAIGNPIKIISFMFHLNNFVSVAYNTLDIGYAVHGMYFRISHMWTLTNKYLIRKIHDSRLYYQYIVVKWRCSLYSASEY